MEIGRGRKRDYRKRREEREIIGNGREGRETIGNGWGRKKKFEKRLWGEDLLKYVVDWISLGALRREGLKALKFIFDIL